MLLAAILKLGGNRGAYVRAVLTVVEIAVKSNPLVAPSQPGTGRKLAIALDRLRLKTRQPALCRYPQRAPDASIRSLIT